MSKRLDFDGLLTAICAGQGYCGALHDDGYVQVTDFIPKQGLVTSEQFIDWVFIAEGESWRDNVSAMLARERLRTCFISYMGGEVVSAHRLRRSRLRHRRISR